MKLFYVIGNGGDGSNFIKWVKDLEVVDKMQEFADDGDEAYASGDGLQVRGLVFPDGFDLDTWIKTNHISITTMEDLMEYRT